MNTSSGPPETSGKGKEEVFNIFDVFSEPNTANSGQNKRQPLRPNIFKMETARSSIPSRVCMMYLSDKPIKQYCQERSLMDARRFLCVDLIFRMAEKMRLAEPVPILAIRIFDRFYSITAVSKWQDHFMIFAAVSLNLAAKYAGWDNNPFGHKQTIEFFHRTVSDPKVIGYNDFVQFFNYIESVVLNTIGFELSNPTPFDYITECCRWFDGSNAARGLAPRPEAERTVATTTIFLITALMHSRESMEFSCHEIAGVATYVATNDRRSAPQPHRVDTPGLQGLWSTITWMRSRELCRVISESIDYTFEHSPRGALSRMFPCEFSKWSTTGPISPSPKEILPVISDTPSPTGFSVAGTNVVVNRNKRSIEMIEMPSKRQTKKRRLFY